MQIFLLKALLIFFVWKFCYYGFLYSNEYLDRPLTKITAATSVVILNGLSTDERYSSHYRKSTAYILNKVRPIFGVKHACNALELYMLYLGFLFCLFIDTKRVVLFSIFGLISIFVLNVIRIVALVSLHAADPELKRISHKYIFTTVVYVCILLLWSLYAKPIRKEA